MSITGLRCPGVLASGPRRNLASVEGADDRAPGAGWDGHVLLLYGSEDERRDGLTAWAGRALGRGEKVVCTEAAGRPEDTLVAVLEARGVAAAAAVREGRLAVLSPEEFFATGLEVADRALAEGFPGVRMSAQESAALSVLSPAARRSFEEQVDELTRTRPVQALCQYAQATTTGAVLDHAVGLHLPAVRQATFSTGYDERGLALRGEVDVTNADVLTAVLAAAGRSSERALCVDLADVDHLAAGSAWRIDHDTRAFRAAGGQVLLVAPQPAVESTLRLLEIDQLPGVRVVGGEP